MAKSAWHQYKSELGIKITEKVLCAAVWVKDKNKYPHQPINIDHGFVVCGLRHANCFAIISIAKKTKDMKLSHTQGFLTNTNRFVDRQEAFKIAKRRGQIIDMREFPPRRGVKYGLGSEDLY